MNNRDSMSRETNDKSGIDELLDRAIDAINNGDRAAASMFAEQVLAVDKTNPEAEDLLTAPPEGGEIRRLTIMFADLVDSTVLSTKIGPEVYRTVVGRYRDHVRQCVERYGGHIASTKGDGLLAVFGHPQAHENDAHRAVQAGLDITREVARLSERVQRQFGFDIHARVGIHRGLVYLDIVQDDVYGLAANLTARVSGLAPPGTVVVSNAIERLVRPDFDLEAQPAQHVKGIEGPVEYHLVLGEHTLTTPSVAGPVVGRDRELSQLEHRWHRACAGTLTERGVAFVGEAGMGKSRLATAAADLAEASSATVLALFGSPFHADAGLHPVRMLLERQCGITRTTTQTDKLRLLEDEIVKRSLDPSEMLALLAPVLGIAEHAGYQAVPADAGELYSRIRAAVRDYVLACLDDKPGVVLLEDLQWFDPSTTDLVRALLRAETGKTLLVLTSRDRDLLTDLADTAALEIIELAPLTDDETDELIDALDPSLSEEQRAEVRRRCDGVPLYIEEVVAKLDQQASDSATWNRVPDALYEPLFARLRASGNALPAVAAAATIGRDVDRALLMTVADIDADEFDRAVAELVQTSVLIPTGTDGWRFRHELLREVAAELAPPSLRRRLHSRIADALVAAAGGQPDWNLVALHCEEAERFDAAAEAWQRASGEARRRGAFGEARTHLTHALANIEKLPQHDSRDQAESAVRLRRGFLTSSIAGPASPDAAADFERCLQLSGSRLTDEVLATMQALFGYYMSRGDIRRATKLLESGRLLSEGGPEWLLQANTAGFATAAWYSGDFTTARTQLEALSATQSRADSAEIDTTWFIPHEPFASLCTLLSLARFVQGDLTGMEAALADTHARCAALGFPHGPFSLAYAHSVEVWMRYECGQFAASQQCVADLMTLAKRYGFDAWLLIAGAEQALVDAVSFLATTPGDLERARHHTDTMAAVVQAMAGAEVKPFLSVYYATLARLQLTLDQPDEARRQVDTALRLSEELGVRFYDSELLRLRAQTGGDADRRRDLRAALDLATTQGANVFRLRAAIDLFELCGAPARPDLLEALSAMPGDDGWPEVSRAQALLA